MKRKIFNSRALALILVLAMAVSLLTISASAATSWSLTGHGTNVASITIDGADFYQPDYTTSTDTHGTIYDYYIELNEATADGTIVSMHFTKAAGEPTDCVISRVPVVANPPQAQQIIWGQRADDYTATVNEGTALARAYVHKNVQSELGKFDTYVFHYYLPYPVSISTGDPVFIAWDGNNGTVAGRDGSSRIPSSFTLWVDGASTITVDGSTVTSDYSNAGNYAFTISPKASGNTTIVAVSGGVTYTITCGPKSATPSGVAPSSVVSYLPIGQFAQGSGWGSSVGKFTNGYASTGVSLGAFGGYIEFKFNDGITNDPENPYGVDFVVYGNAFNGNPEAGAVQVSEDGITWYELAGSRYYDGNFAESSATQASGKFSKGYTGTLNNAAVYYTTNTAATLINAEVKVGAATKLNVQPLINSYGWWPTTAKGYPMAGSHNNAGSNVQVSHSDAALMFSGLTLIPDSDDTAYYAFGYADVTPNGSPATYGDAVNPYKPYNYTENGTAKTKTGGDGFDLEWAVDISTRLPIDVTGKTFRYVRVYTAVLDNGTFGETSAEVCGIFTTANKSDTTVSRTGKPTAVLFQATGKAATVINQIPATGGTVTKISDIRNGAGDAEAVNVTISAPSGSTVYVNNTCLTESRSGIFTGAISTPAAGQYLRVIVQNGEMSPYMFVIV